MIRSFHGEYRFLSNFWPAKVVLDGILFPTVEHAYQAAKTMDMAERRRIAEMEKPGDAKKAGRKLKVRDDWDKVKVIYMERLLLQKFRDADLHLKLLQTDDEELVEGNTWGDTFWGVCNDVGDNRLGKILMKIRNGMTKEY